MTTVTDQLGRKVGVPENPRRIVSLVPSQTELLADLGLSDRVVGITKFCVHPAPWLKEKTIVGGTKQLHYERIKALQPDLILANKEENTREIVETLAQDYPVWVSDIYTLAQALEMITAVGELTQSRSQAQKIVQRIDRGFSQLQPAKRQSALYLIWRKPYLAAGRNTFINDMLERAGYPNVLPPASRYPELSPEAIAELQPRVILLSSEPYPFKEKHRAELQEIVPTAQVKLVDGELFSWYGSRLQYTPAYLKSLQ